MAIKQIKLDDVIHDINAVRLDIDTKGSTTQPVYFSEGKPVACTYELKKTVPSDAKFTDTTYTLNSFGITATAAELNKMDGVTATTTELNYVDGVTSSIQAQLDAKVPTSRTVNGKALLANITLSASDVGADASGSASSALTSAKSYTDREISKLVNNASTETLDSIAELADAIEENDTAIEALNSVAASKANASDLTSHTGNKSNPHGVTKAQVGLGNVENKSSATIRGELTKANVTTALGYTPPTTNTTYGVVSTTANGLAPKLAGGTAKYLRADGTWTVPPDTDTVYTHPSYTARTGKPTANATPAFGGTFTVSQITSDATGHVTAATDRTITIPSTLSNGTGTAGLIKTTSKVTSKSGYTACPVISGVPYYKDTKNTYSLSSFGITATAAELNYCDGVTSNIQTQLNGKLPSAHATLWGTGRNIALSANAITAVSIHELSGAVNGYFAQADGGGGIKCLKSGYVLVSGSVYVKHSSSAGRSGCYVYKNDLEVLSQYTLPHGESSISSGTKIILVNAGDVLYLKARCSVAGTLIQNHQGTFLSAMYVSLL